MHEVWREILGNSLCSFILCDSYSDKVQIRSGNYLNLFLTTAISMNWLIRINNIKIFKTSVSPKEEIRNHLKSLKLLLISSYTYADRYLTERNFRLKTQLRIFNYFDISVKFLFLDLLLIRKWKISPGNRLNLRFEYWVMHVLNNCMHSQLFV